MTRSEYPLHERVWLHCILCVVGGALASLAQAPWYWSPLYMLGMGGLFFLCGRNPGVRASALLGWCYGLGYYFVGVQWVGEAFLVDAARFAWMQPFAIGFLAALMGLFAALACAVARWVARTPTAHAFAFVAAWGAAEWLRGVAFTGFPWHHPAYLWTVRDDLMQGAALIGPHGLGLLAVAIAIAPAYALQCPRGRRAPGLIWLALGLFALLGLWGYGHQRLVGAQLANVEPPVRLRIVQPVLTQKDKWRPELRDSHLANYLELTARAPEFRPTHVIWPETATPFLLMRDTKRRQLIAANLPPGSQLLTGTPRYQGQDISLTAFNSLVLLDPSGRLTLLYDKRHLVPFGEYLPFRSVLSLIGLDRLAVSAVDFSSGELPQVSPLPGAPSVRPLICYEVIFPAESAVTPRPGWLLNITNDAWFGDSAGPRQHLAIARMRAVEQGLPLVRAANTGVSALIDPYGRILQSLDIGLRGIIDRRLPAALPSPPPYAIGGDLPFLLLLLGCVASALPGRRQRPFSR